MTAFTYFCSAMGPDKDGNPQQHAIDLPDERVNVDEWCARSRMGGVPPLDRHKPISAQLHHTDLCTRKCKQPVEAMGRTHAPPGVPQPYWFCEVHQGWATLTPINTAPQGRLRVGK